jgi:flagellar assembly protein FliH
MSTEEGFSRISFPSLRDGRQEQVEEQARVRGHAAGYAAGLRAAAAEVKEQQARLQAEHEAAVQNHRARVEQTVQALHGAVRALQQRTAPVLADAQHTLAAAAMELAEAVLGCELADGERGARAALARALADVDASSVHMVRMHPADLSLLEPEVRRQAGVDFVPDSSLARGDAVTEFADGYLDAKIGTALVRARAALQAGAP